MVVRKVKPGMFDVFMGKGWDNWGRFITRHTQFGTQVKQIAGHPFTHIDKEEVEGRFNQKH